MKTTSEPIKPYSILATLLITVAVFILGQLIAAILLEAILSLLNAGGGSLFESKTSRVFLFILLSDAAMLGLLAWFMKFKAMKLNDLGVNRLQLKYLGYILLGFGLYFIIYIGFLLLSSVVFPGLNLEQEQDIGFSSSTRGSALILVFLSLVIFPPITEEIIMRGFLFGNLRKHLPFIFATLTTSVIFAAAHLPSGKTGLLWIGAIDTFILSFVLCYLREHTQSLWPPIGVHMIKNSVAFLVLFKLVG